MEDIHCDLQLLQALIPPPHPPPLLWDSCMYHSKMSDVFQIQKADQVNINTLKH